ncbi:MAG TPA: hypothetical protein VFF09_05715 [archaeon]|nr:hypothetical protein [archaeon]
MRWGFLITAIAVLALFSSAAFGAVVSGFENSIIVGERPHEFSFYAENDSATKQPLTVEFNFPAKVVAENMPEYIPANSSSKVSVLIYPEKSLEGSSYKGMVLIDVGGNKAEKNVSIDFRREDSCTVKAEAQESDEGALVKFSNSSFKTKSLSLVEAKNLPSDWSVAGEKEFVLGSFEEKSFGIALEKGSSFEGAIEFVFSCADGSSSAEAEMKHESAGMFSGLSGMAVFVADGISGFGGAAGGADSQFIIDAVLAIVAAILMIAFVARLVKVLYRRERQTRLVENK